MAVHVRRSRQPDHAWARYLSMAVAAWLVLSAFVWPHGYGQATNAWAVGSLAFFFSLAGLLSRAARLVNLLLAVWLVLTTLLAPHGSTATVINDCTAAGLIFLLALVPGTRGEPSEPDRPLRA